MKPTTNSQRIRFAAIMFVAFVVRGGIAYWQQENLTDDPDAYRRIAETLQQTGVYGVANAHGKASATAFRPPLYPYFLSWLTKDGRLANGPVAILHVVLGLLTVACTLIASRRLVDGGTIGWATMAAGLLVAIDPILLQQSTLVMTETIAAAITSVTFWWWVCHYDRSTNFHSSVVLGVFLSLAYLCRPTFLVWGILVAMSVVFAHRDALSKRFLRAAIVGGIVALTLGVWTVRNARMTGHPVWATSHGGYTLLLANNPSFYDYLRNGKWGEVWDAESFLTAYDHRFNGDPNRVEFWRQDWSGVPVQPSNAKTEHGDDQVAYHAARATINRQPSMFVWSAIVRVGRLWSPMPHFKPGRSRTGVIAVGIYYTLFYFALAYGTWRLRRTVLRPPWWPVLALVLTLTAVHAVYWSNLRMRAPAIPCLVIIAAASIGRLTRDHYDPLAKQNSA